MATAYFKIKKGKNSALANITPVEGTVYITSDTHKMYIDLANGSGGRICLNAVTADELSCGDVGASNKPIYFDDGFPVEGSIYAGGTKVTLNGSDKGATTASFYAPTAVGTKGQLLTSNGSGAPAWSSIAYVTSTTSSGQKTTGPINALNIYGTTYGNDSAYLLAAGKLSYGDPGPQIRFATSPTGTQSAALIFTDHDTIGAGVSLSLVSNQSDTWFIAPTIKALNKFVGDLSGNATTATRLATARTISLSGDASGSASFNGSANATITVTIADDSHNHIISNVDGLQDALNNKMNSSISSIELNNSGALKSYGGFIDFHYHNSDGKPTTSTGTVATTTPDYTSRIIESAAGVISVNGVTFKNGIMTGSLNGNASTTSKLEAAVNINGTSFDGSKSITTANWGTARKISISSAAGTTGTSVNGSADVTLVIPSTLTGFSSISSSNFRGVLRRTYERDTSNAIHGITWYDANDTSLHQYIMGHNTANAIIINPRYDPAKDAWNSAYGLYITDANVKYNNNILLDASNYKNYALPLAGGTVTGTLILSKTTDAATTTDSGPALIVGGTRTSAHIEIDANEVLAKSNGTTETDLYLGTTSSKVHIGQSNVGSSTGPIYLAAGVPTACSGRTVPGIKSASAVTTLGWGTNNNYIADISLLAYWNGAYANTNSNLQYCYRGQFGTIVTRDATDYLRYYDGNTEITTTETVNTPTYLHTVSTTGGAITTAVKPTGMDNAWGVLHVHTHSGNYATQLGFGGTTGNLYMRNAYNSASFSAWRTILDSGNWTGIVDGRYVKKTGDTMSGSLSMGNNAITGVNNLAFADPGVNEGISWTGGNGWQIQESPDDLTNAAGNLQFVHGSTRRLTINKDGYVDINARVVVRGNGSSYNEGIRILPASNGWSNIFFSNNTTLSDTHDGGWLIGKRGAAGTAYIGVTPAAGDFTIEEQSSSGVNLTIHKNSGGATLRGRFRTDGELQSVSANGLRLVYGNYGIILRNDGSDFYILSTASGKQYDTWNDLRPFAIKITSGRVTMSQGLNVGYTNTSYALSASSFICNSWVRTVGSTGWYNESYGGGWYMSDGNYVRSYNSKAALIGNNLFIGTSSGAGTGIALYSTELPNSYGIHMSLTSNYGKHGDVQGDWANYFCFNGATNRGWIFKQAGTNVASISGSGHLTLNGQLKRTGKSSSWINGRDNALIRMTACSGYSPTISAKTPLGSWEIGTYDNAGFAERLIFSYASDSNYNAGTNTTVTTVNIANNGRLYGAAWNDYAEFRACHEDFEPGQVVYENGDDTLSVSYERLQRGCSIVSDTYGFAINESENTKCPIAVSGRVLAYPYESREEFKKHIGWPVCSGPNGTVSIMTEEEEERYPSRIIGIIASVPDYETWGQDKSAIVNGRVWIKVL